MRSIAAHKRGSSRRCMRKVVDWLAQGDDDAALVRFLDMPPRYRADEAKRICQHVHAKLREAKRAGKQARITVG